MEEKDREEGAEELLKETITAGFKMGIIKENMLSRINVDTTVQEKNVCLPTDMRLYDQMREKLVKMAEEEGIELRQNFNKFEFGCKVSVAATSKGGFGCGCTVFPG